MRTPAIFFGHGNPMYAIEDNAYSRAWASIGQSIEKPRAVLCISAHWYEEGVAVTGMEHPRTIHDFGGFPRALYEVQYPAPGDPAVARRVVELLAPLDVQLDADWGLDHGSWSVLRHVFPNADVPVIQLSIDMRRPPRFHFALGKQLAPLRDEGILICGSGNIVHNLRMMQWSKDPQPYDWAVRFDALVRASIARRDFTPLVNYETFGNDALMSAPTPDHYLPLLYVLGASDDDDAVSFPVEGLDAASISMRAVRFG